MSTRQSRSCQALAAAIRASLLDAARPAQNVADEESNDDPKVDRILSLICLLLLFI
jgi:hypothetical protein